VSSEKRQISIGKKQKLIEKQWSATTQTDIFSVFKQAFAKFTPKRDYKQHWPLHWRLHWKKLLITKWRKAPSFRRCTFLSVRRTWCLSSGRAWKAEATCRLRTESCR